MRNIALVGLLVAVCSACDSPTPDRQLVTEGQPMPLPTPELAFRLVLRDKFSQVSAGYVQGEDIQFLMSIENLTNEDAILRFPSCQTVDFHVADSMDIEVWRASDGMAYCQASTQMTIPANSTTELSDSWNQVLATGENIPIGAYTAYGSLLEESLLDTPRLVSFDFTIQ